MHPLLAELSHSRLAIWMERHANAALTGNWQSTPLAEVFGEGKLPAFPGYNGSGDLLVSSAANLDKWTSQAAAAIGHLSQTAFASSLLAVDVLSRSLGF